MRVIRFTMLEHTFASCEEVWHALALSFADGIQHVIASVADVPAQDEVARVLAAIRIHRRTVVDEGVYLGTSNLSLGVVLSLLPTAIWALVLAVFVAPIATALVLAPLPIALVLHAIATRCARHCLDPHYP